ncbi:hypothetical protein [Nocardia salmonicida]|uniref:hypothetical protein n=1 Tax=Nocardia salmonicida TaxID=53431 RepID=UPI003403EB72
MTVYAFDEARRAFITTWETGVGTVATLFSEVPESATVSESLEVASTLTSLSRQVWRTYTHPASAADSLEVNSEGWRRQGERDAFADVVAAVRAPNLPEAGGIIQSYIRVEEAAHRVGRALNAIGNHELIDRVVTDVEHELAAVEQAERGELSGRARQAVVLTRADASPSQVAAASDLLHAYPLGAKSLLQEVDPTSAAVAAAHWLQAAAEVTSRVADCDPTRVVVQADNIEALGYETPTLVLELLHSDATPYEVVLHLVKAAMAVAEGEILDPDFLIEQIEAGEQQRVLLDGVDDEHLGDVALRITPLDPRRPAHDLLEDLLDGIRGCLLVYGEHADYETDEAFDDPSDEASEALRERIDAEFFDAVRAEAAANRMRLA